MKTSSNRRKKLVLVRGRASEILAAVHVGAVEERRAKAALAAVSRLETRRAMTPAQKRAARKRAAARRRALKHAALRPAQKPTFSAK